MNNFVSRVSSVLNNDVKNYGKRFMFDRNEETCWNSSEGSPQWIEILFNDSKLITGLEFQFQGGFVGQKCNILLYEDPPTPISSPIAELNNFYPEDSNVLQTYTLESPVEAKFIRIVFNGSSDFYGRIILYRLNVL